MNISNMIDELKALIGVDASISVDDEDRPSRFDFYRPDRISDDLVREAVGRVATAFPDHDWRSCEYFVSYDENLGRTRRRVVA
jgi:hypothetical protein